MWTKNTLDSCSVKVFEEIKKHWKSSTNLPLRLQKLWRPQRVCRASAGDDKNTGFTLLFWVFYIEHGHKLSLSFLPASQTSQCHILINAQTVFLPPLCLLISKPDLHSTAPLSIPPPDVLLDSQITGKGGVVLVGDHPFWLTANLLVCKLCSSISFIVRCLAVPAVKSMA